MHEAGHFPGHSLARHAGEIAALIDKTKAKTLLDYGSGKGRQYMDGSIAARWGAMPVLFDPAVRGLDARPGGTFDGVICTDVLEHIPEDEVEAVVSDIFGFADKFVFLSICTREARKTLPDGRNCHLTVKPEQWWLSLIARLNPGLLYEVKWNA